MKKQLLAFGISLLSLIACYGKKDDVKQADNSDLAMIDATASSETVRIASFNIEIFGKSKRQKPDVIGTLTDIVAQYDLIAVQEFRDKTEQTIPFFLDRINEKRAGYNVIASERLGRTSCKERYAFFFDENKITYLNISYVYEDTDDDFEREPHIAYFRAGNFDFFLVNIHTKPKHAAKEIAELAEVIESIQKKYPNEEDIIVLGDFNADSRYFDESDITHPMRAQRFKWIIPNDFDTTVALSSNTYDRILFLKETLEDFTGNKGVDHFDTRYGLTNEQAMRISNHYPIWAEFRVDVDSD